MGKDGDNVAFLVVDVTNVLAAATAAVVIHNQNLANRPAECIASHH